MATLQPTLLTISEAAERKKTTRLTIRRALERGDLNGARSARGWGGVADDGAFSTWKVMGPGPRPKSSKPNDTGATAAASGSRSRRKATGVSPKESKPSQGIDGPTAATDAEVERIVSGIVERDAELLRRLA